MTLTLELSFKHRAAGRTFDLLAIDDASKTQEFYRRGGVTGWSF